MIVLAPHFSDLEPELKLLSGVGFMRHPCEFCDMTGLHPNDPEPEPTPDPDPALWPYRVPPGARDAQDLECTRERCSDEHR